MGNLYIVTYLTPNPKDVQRLRRNHKPQVSEFKREQDYWPYDTGDDPSFYSWQQYRNQGGRLTWGVCRPDVREAIQPGDVVAFFAYLRRPMPKWEAGTYLFVGYGTVDKKVSPGAIWSKESLGVYQSYLNHLVKPEEGRSNRFPHWEPVDKHDDWLWRVAEHKGHKKEDFQKVHDSEVFVEGESKAKGKEIRFGENYVLFQPGAPQTYILSNPIPVAQYPGENGPFEVWCESEASNAVRRLTINRSPNRNLRTTNPQQPHRHIRVECDTAEWVKSAVSCLESWVPSILEGISEPKNQAA